MNNLQSWHIFKHLKATIGNNIDLPKFQYSYPVYIEEKIIEDEQIEIKEDESIDKDFLNELNALLHDLIREDKTDDFDDTVLL